MLSDHQRTNVGESSAPPPQTLLLTVRVLARPTLTLDDIDTLALAASRLRQNGSSILPVLKNGKYIGIINEPQLARALGAGVNPTDPVANWVVPGETILPYETGAESLRRTEYGGTLVVVDAEGRIGGILSSIDLWPRRRHVLRPPFIGGMATPFGVYLTTGTVSGGVNKWALVGTGVVMSLMMIVAMLASNYACQRALGMGVKESVLDIVNGPLMILVFLCLMRISPLAGTHGAEHQVVHAIEHEEDLIPRVIRRMPRVHPRCGTNLVAGAGIFTSILFSDWVDSQELRLLTAAIVTVFLWRRVGGILQQFVTTKRPNDSQLNSGIRAGEMLLERYATSPANVPSIPQRIWNSGIFPLMAGAMGTSLLVTFLGKVLNLPDPLRVL